MLGSDWAAAWLPITLKELTLLEDLLNKSNVIVLGNYSIEQPTTLSEYIFANLQGSVEFRALFDRNLISPLIRLASGKSLVGSKNEIEAGRLACASLAFCILANILVEPSMALYEYASSDGNQAAQSEFIYFRIADNIDPRAYLEIALGKADRLPETHIFELVKNPNVTTPHCQESNFAKQLNMWKPNYLFVLKAVELVRSSPSSISAALQFLNWQTHETFYNAAASMYCLAALSHKPPKGGMLKSARSDNPSAVKAGIINATWDICLLRQFGQLITAPSPSSWSLWSSDIALKYVARNLFIEQDEQSTIQLWNFLSRCWGRDTEQLANKYHTLKEHSESSSSKRHELIAAAFKRINKDIEELEDRLGIASIN